MSGRQNIYNTSSVASMMPPSMIEDLEQFLITNRHFILTDQQRTEAFRTRFSGNTLISHLVHRLVILGKDQSYSLIRLPTKTTALRESVDMTFVPYDILQMKEITPSVSKSLSLVPELDNKLVINVTDISRSNGDFSNVVQFQNRVVRDFLSRSFYISQGNVWISPTLVRYVAKVYSMTIGGQTAKLYNLSLPLQTFVQTVFCAFFVGQMTNQDIALEFMRAHARAMNLPDSTNLNDIMSLVKETLGKNVPSSIAEVCKVIDAYGHDQLRDTHGSRFTRAILNMRFRSLAQDGQVSTIALEYAPYFTFLILSVLSKDRTGLSIHMKGMNLIKEGEEVFDQLIKSPTFLNSL